MALGRWAKVSRILYCMWSPTIKQIPQNNILPTKILWDWGQEEKGMTEDEMAGWHHRLDGREFEWTPRVGDGQGGLVCCDSWGHKESDMTKRLNWTELNWGRWAKVSRIFYCMWAPIIERIPQNNIGTNRLNDSNSWHQIASILRAVTTNTWIS